MSDVNSKSTSTSDEVDLILILMNVIGFLGKTWWYFIVATLVGIGVGLTIFYTTPKVYQSKLTAECMALPDSRVVDLINDLKKLTENGDVDQLAKKLGLSFKDADQIESIEALSSIKIDKEAIGVDEYLLPSSTSHIFSVIVQVRDNDVLQKLQQGLVRYIGDNEYSQIRVKQFIKNRNDLVAIIDKQLQKLDSANSVYETKLLIKEGPNITLSHPGDFRILIVQLLERKLQLDNEIELAEAVRVIQNFTVFSKPIAPKRLGLIIQYVLIANVLLLLGLFIMSIRVIYAKNNRG